MYYLLGIELILKFNDTSLPLASNTFKTNFLVKGRAPHASPTLAELSKSSGKRLIQGSLDIT